MQAGKTHLKSLFALGQPRFGRLDSVPERIDIRQFKYKTPFSREITGWKKQLKYKQFQFISINNPDYMFGLAIVDLGWVGHGFFYCYEHQRKNIEELSFLQPAAYLTSVCSNEQGVSCFKKYNFLIQIEKTAQERKVLVKQGERILLDACIDTTTAAPLSLCTPTGATGWTYTQKRTTLAVTGLARTTGKLIDLHDQQFMAAIDDSCGMLRHETAWHWLSLSGYTQNGHKIGLNLATGVNETFATENTLWLNGQIFEMPPVFFKQITVNQWQVFSADGRIDLTVKTGWRRYESKNFMLVASQFSQWVSFISGKITDHQQTYEIKEQMALLEKHYAKW